jgi:hypothetical protein
VNAKNLEQIESAMIIVALDDTKPVTREAISWGCWAGDGRNRFYDKHQRTRVWLIFQYSPTEPFCCPEHHLSPQ